MIGVLVGLGSALLGAWLAYYLGHGRYTFKQADWIMFYVLSLGSSSMYYCLITLIFYGGQERYSGAPDLWGFWFGFLAGWVIGVYRKPRPRI